MNKTDRTSRKRRMPSWLVCIIVALLSSFLTIAVSDAINNSRQPTQATEETDSPQPLPQSAKNPEKAQDNTEHTFIDNWYMDTRVKYTMDGIWHRMGNVEEILDAVKNIRHTSELSWFREWNKKAEKVQSMADEYIAGGHEISAGEAYLRAANYYLTAELFLHTNPEDFRILETYKKGADCFIKGLQLLNAPVSEVWIPYENTKIKGYFFKAQTLREKAPVLLVHQGFDAPIESTKYIAEEAARRGYHCLLFEGPGQGLTIREQNIPFRPDWENVVSPVVDYVLDMPCVDGENVYLMGVSMGGGFAVRAAAFEKRLKLCIVNPGYISVCGIIEGWLTEKMKNLYQEDKEEFDDKFKELTRYDVGIRWGMYHGMWVFGAQTPSGFLDKLKEFDCKDILDQIECTMLIMDGTGESWGAGQAKHLYDSLNCPKHYMLFTEEESAEQHCQSGCPAVSVEKLFNWLDDYSR